MGSGSSHPKPPKQADNDVKQKLPSEALTHHGSQTPVMRAGVQGKDVMISYSHQDIDVMRSIKELLESSGISVWVDETNLTPGTAFLREIGEAIVDSKMFLVILSPDSVTSKYCQDEVSLAYISNKTIFTVAVKAFEELTPNMDLGLKLTLSGMQWHILDGKKDISDELGPLVSSVKAALDVYNKKQFQQDSDPESNVSEGDEETESNFIMNKQALKTFTRSPNNEPTSPEEDIGEIELVDKEFWASNFHQEKEVDWPQFQKLVDNTYKDLWKQMMVTEQQKNLLFHLMSKEMRVTKGRVTYKAHQRFCTREREQLPLSQAIRLFAAETYAMKGVFDVDSSVRLSAIGNLSKYQSKAVIDALLDLLERDDDPDVIVVAAISLAHAASGIKMFKRRAEESLLECLNSSDRLVRESGCLALGRLKSKKSIEKLVALWRNDTISSVREAAQMAIDQIGGEEAEQALHVTKVLSKEIQFLKK